MAMFVPLTVEDPAYELVGILNRLNGVKPVDLPKQDKPEAKEGETAEVESEELRQAKASKLGKLVAAKQHQKLLEEGFLKSVNKIFESAADTDSAFSLAISILPHVGRDHVGGMVHKFAQTLATDKAKKWNPSPIGRLQLLNTLFNYLDAPSVLRFTILVHMCELALSSDNAALLIGQFDHVDEWLTQWQVEPAKSSKLSSLIVQIYKAAGDEADFQKYNHKYLSTLPSGQEDSGAELAKDAVVQAVKALDVDKLDNLSKLPVVKNLEKKAPLYHALLSVFVTGNVIDFNAFAAKNGKFLKEIGVDQDTAVSSMQKLTICSLAAENDQLSYALLQEKLGVKEGSDVEEVVIDAVAAGLLGASIDQQHEVVYITSTTQRSFNEETDWAALQDKLNVWKDTVADTLENLQNGDELQD